MSKETSRIKHITLSLFIGLLIIIAVMTYDIVTTKPKECKAGIYNGEVYNICYY